MTTVDAPVRDDAPVLVTGAPGNMGTPLVGKLLGLGAQVQVAALTYDECATILTEVLGRPIRYADPTPWHYWRRMRRRGMPPR